jgi:error-prone DNA polymerase
MSLKAHPMKLLRESFAGDGTLCCGALTKAPDGSHVRTAGLVLMRQRPGEGHAIFITLEDETGVANAIVWESQFEAFRSPLLGSRLMAVEGKLQCEGSVTHIICERLYNLNDRLNLLTPKATARTTTGGHLLPASRDFR